MRDFNWGIFWALVAYGALKFGIKRTLGLYGARAKQTKHKPSASSRRATSRQTELGNVGFSR